MFFTCLQLENQVVSYFKNSKKITLLNDRERPLFQKSLFGHPIIIVDLGDISASGIVK